MNENTAAAVMLKTPAIVVASRMEMRIGSILMPLVRVLQLPQDRHCTAQIAEAHFVRAKTAPRMQRGDENISLYFHRRAWIYLPLPVTAPARS
ncbi:hypothetical protein [Massilia eurypsychrophila]|uniref:hypothetical protein n=1 Tax=Massilia eurypsychrophila TaxID=1485217 RepID=UPI001034B3D2|nr:hypothetical protein [Massilia eurypsychrophila]